MNHPGTEKIYYIQSKETTLPGTFNPGIVINLSGFLNGSLTELEYEPGSFNLTQTQEETRAGRIKKATASFVVSGINETIHFELLKLAEIPHVFVFLDNEGRYLLCGSQKHNVKFNYTLTHTDPPGSIKNYKCNITFESVHGLVFCSFT